MKIYEIDMQEVLDELFNPCESCIHIQTEEADDESAGFSECFKDCQWEEHTGGWARSCHEDNEY